MNQPPPPKDWQHDAACKGKPTELFFIEAPSRQNKTDVDKAKAICAECAAQPECLAWAMRNEAFGIWGGQTQTERARNGGIKVRQPRTVWVGA